MKKGTKKRIWNPIFVLLLSFSMVLPSSASSISDVKKEKEALEKELDKVEETLGQLNTDKNSIESYVEDLDVELNKLSSNLNELSNKLENKEAELEQTKAELEEAKATEQKQYESMKKRIKYMYEKGNVAYIEVLFSSENIADLINKAEYVTKISEYDRDMLIRYQETKLTIAEKEAQIEQEYKEIEELQKEVKNEQASTQKLINQKSAQIAEYEENIESTEALLAEYEAEIAEQDAVIKELEAAAAAAKKKAEEEAAARAAEAKRKAEEAAAAGGEVTSDTTGETETPPQAPSYSGGQFTWPTPSSRRITSEYGYRIHPTLGVNKFHNGIDIGASTGSAIVAAASGTVVGAGYNSSMGNYVMIDHGSGLFTIYMHASSLLVSSGQSVSAGSTIALVGSTGRSTGPHLHFGVRLNGDYVSPWNYLG